MRTRKWMLVVMLVAVMLGCMGCKTDEADAPATESAMSVDWGEVNESLQQYNLSAKGYYLGDNYLEEEKESNVVMISNYAPDVADAFKEVDYQLTISYGEIMRLNEIGAGDSVYDEPMIEIFFVDNGSEEYYVAVYDMTGALADEEGTWFLEDQKDEVMTEKVADSMAMFGL